MTATCAPAHLTKEIPYRGANGPGSERCVLDLYQPLSDMEAPLLVWFHGGGLSGGDKEEGIPLASLLAAHGIATAFPHYRLSPKHPFPASVEDAADAVAWAFRHAAECRIDPKRIFFGGYSAGGYLAAMLTMDPRYLRAAGDDIFPAGSIILSAQVTTHFQICAERQLPPHALLVNESAPLYFCRADTIPFRLLVADNDIPGRLEENILFARRLELAGNQRFQFKIIPARDHSTIFSQIQCPGDEVAFTILEFLQTGVSF